MFVVPWKRCLQNVYLCKKIYFEEKNSQIYNRNQLHTTLADDLMKDSAVYSNNKNLCKRGIVQVEEEYVDSLLVML